MKLDNFELESWMTIHEKDYKYNLAESCVAPLSINELLDFCDNKEEIMQNLLETKLDYGPIVGSDELKKGILKLYDTGDFDNITITHGCISANELVLTTLLDRDDHIVTITPTYQQLYSLPQSFGVETSFVELQKDNDWNCEVSQFKELIKENTKMICLTSPNNPTGTSFKEDFLVELVQLGREYGLYIFIDEAYRGASSEKEVSISDMYELGVSTGSMSKTFGLPGLRMGWVKGPKDLIVEINERRDYHIISSGYLHDYLASIAFEHYEDIHQRTLDICVNNRKVLQEWLLTQEHVTCTMPTTGTIAFLRYDLDIPSKELCVQLQEDTGVFFVPGACCGVENHLRFGMANTTENIKKGLELFSIWLKKHEK